MGVPHCTRKTAADNDLSDPRTRCWSSLALLLIAIHQSFTQIVASVCDVGQSASFSCSSNRPLPKHNNLLCVDARHWSQRTARLVNPAPASKLFVAKGRTRQSDLAFLLQYVTECNSSIAATQFPHRPQNNRIPLVLYVDTRI